MAEDVHKNTHSIYPLAKETIDTQSTPTRDYICRFNQSNPLITEETTTKPTTTKSRVSMYKLCPKYKPDKNRLILQQIQALDEEYETIRKQQQQSIRNCNCLLDRQSEINQQTTR